MTCLHLNPSLDKSKLLDATQVASMKIHVIEALKVAQDFLFPTQKTTAAAAAAQPQTPAATAASKTQPGYIDFDSVDMYSAFGNEEWQGSTNSTLSVDHVALEFAAYASLTKDDFSISTVHGKFDPAFLWAHPSIEARFPLHCHAARSHYSALIMKQPRNALLVMSLGN